MSAFFGVVGAPSVLMLLLRTALLMLGTVLVSLCVALPMAWLVTWTDLPARRWFTLLGALPLVFPSYLAALTLVAFLGPRGGLQGWLEPLGITRLPELAYGYSGALLALSLFVYPYVYLPLLARLREVDPAVFESARSLGRSPFAAFCEVILPQLRVSLLGGSLLVALYAASDFGAVSIVRYDTFTLSIYNAYRGLFDRTTAASLACALVVLTLGLVMLEGRLVGPLRTQARVPRQRALVALHRWRWPAVLFLSAVAVISVALPLGVLVFWGVRGLVTGAVRSSGTTLPQLVDATVGSLSASLPAALAASLAALFPVAWAARAARAPGRSSAWPSLVERLCFTGHALPGIVVALSLVFFATRALPMLYQTLPLLVFAYVVRFLPEAARAQRASLVAVPARLEEAAQGLGSPPMEVLLTVTLPLVRRGLLIGGGLVFLTAMKELPATLVLAPAGFDTLAVRTWKAAGEGIWSGAAAPGLLLLLVTAVPTWWLVLRPILSESR